MAKIGHNKPPFVSITSLTDQQKKELKDAVRQLNDSMTRVASERDFQKEAINEVSDKTGVDKKIIRRMAKVYYQSNYSEVVEEQKNFEEFYSNIMQ